MGFNTMTPIQSKAIPPLLAGKDLIGAAKYYNNILIEQEVVKH